MDCWYHEGDDDQLIFSSASLPRELFDSGSYGTSFGRDDSSSVPSLTYGEAAGYLELGDSDLIEQQFYQAAVYMGCDSREIEFGMSTLSNINMDMEISPLFAEDFIEQPLSEEFFQPGQSHSSSSPSPLQSLSMGSPECSYLLVNNTSTAATKQATQPTPAVASPCQMNMRAYNKYDRHHFGTPSSDDAVITRVMAAIISSYSSPSSSSSSSSPSSMLHQPLQQAQTHQNPANARDGVFKPYNSALAPEFEPKKSSCSQKMIKMSFSMLRRINSMSEEARTQECQPTSIQLQHILSERKRREKLNGSFHALRLLLPAGSKKDKASVLTNTRNYLNTLNAQISKLEEENRMLEMHLLATDEAEEVERSIEKVRVQSVKGFKSKSGVQQVEFEIAVRVECDMIELVLHVLECLKGMRFASLISFDVNMRSRQMDLLVQATLKLLTKASDWDEESFKEAMSRAVDGVMATP